MEPIVIEKDNPCLNQEFSGSTYYPAYPKEGYSGGARLNMPEGRSAVGTLRRLHCCGAREFHGINYAWDARPYAVVDLIVNWLAVQYELSASFGILYMTSARQATGVCHVGALKSLAEKNEIGTFFTMDSTVMNPNSGNKLVSSVWYWDQDAAREYCMDKSPVRWFAQYSAWCSARPRQWA